MSDSDDRKSKKSRIAKYIFVVISVILIAIMANPLRRSENIIRNSLLKLTPVGTDMESVIETLESQKNYEIMYISHEHGYGMANDRPSDAAVSYWQKEIGKKSIRVHLGEYREIFCVDVVAYYGFSEENELIDVAVKKYYDSL